MGFIRKFRSVRCTGAVLALLAGIFAAGGAAAQDILPPSPSAQPSVRLEAEQQRKEGDLYVADGNVEIQYKNFRLRADHVEYNTKTFQAAARGHILFDVDTQHLTAESADFNVQSGAGVFEHVRGEITTQHLPNANILISPNPLTFDAQEVRRLDANTYSVEHAWLTVCELDKPSWKFSTSHATLHVDRTVAMLNANFQLFRIPLLYFPYASLPAGRNLRKSGFLIPEFADTSVKGFVFGDGYYWAPKDWTDLTLGMAYLSRRGWQQSAEFRAKPWENVSISAKYFGVIDRGLPGPLLNAQGNPVLEEPGRPQRAIQTGRGTAQRVARGRGSQSAHLPDLPTGVCADLRRSGQFRSPQCGIPDEQLSRVQRQFRRGRL